MSVYLKEGLTLKSGERMRIEVQHHCSDFNSYRAARVKSLFQRGERLRLGKDGRTTHRKPGMANRTDCRSIR